MATAPSIAPTNTATYILEYVSELGLHQFDLRALIGDLSVQYLREAGDYPSNINNGVKELYHALWRHCMRTREEEVAKQINNSRGKVSDPE